MKDNRIINAFAELKSAGKKTLLPFFTAGYPDVETTGGILHDIEKRGVKICELGIPFSDPIADGPTIQASYSAALDAGVTLQKLFDMVRSYRAEGGQLGLLMMVSYSIVFRYGAEKFCIAAADAGVDGLIVPDLPMGEAEAFAPLAEASGLCNVMLIAPTTPEDRKVEIAKQSTGFVYYISVSGITGERTKLPPETVAAVAELKTHTDTPVCVGFGISNPETVVEVCKAADGAIVGSAFIHRINDAVAANAPREEIVANVGQLVSELIAPLA
ncbi:MAG: tryptophan synthase subunit alpha [Phycisphaerae bacterium]|nr:tryptophan synthase subunit alpha [Phycisphaerae bacterium]